MTLPELTFCIWEGDPLEYFTFRDMNRITYNANILAREAGVTQVQFVEADRTQQFRYDEMQKVETLTGAIALNVGVSVQTFTEWGPGRALNYEDFERVESNLYTIYRAMGGIGDRIDSGKYKRVVTATLFPDEWTGSPPHIDVDVPMARTTSELFAFVSNDADVEERIAEMEARFSVAILSDRVLRITATGIVPKIIIPIRIALGGLSTIETKTLSTAWSGSGPWTQDVSLSATPANVVVGMPSGITAQQSEDFARAGIHASTIDGTTLTIRAIFEKPTRQIPIGIFYNTESVV